MDFIEKMTLLGNIMTSDYMDCMEAEWKISQTRGSPGRRAVCAPGPWYLLL